ncbi:MAG TPA: MFS transporter [Acidimicrobiales bacterium]|nr:MFS transporter [Acidimicrobiales bacterium]
MPWRVDLSPLRRRQVRLVVGGQGLSTLAAAILAVALPFELFRLTRSSFAVGLLGAVEVVPLAATALLGGLAADSRDRRRVVLWATAAGLLVPVALSVADLRRGVSGWMLYLAAGVAFTTQGLARPSLEAVLPRVAGPGELAPAIAASSMAGGAAMVGGAAGAGALIAWRGPAAAYLAAAGTGLAAVILLLRLTAPASGSPGELSIGALREGVSYAASRPELLGTYLVDVVAMVFGMPLAVMPAVAARMGSASALGLLYAAPSAGAILAAALSGRAVTVARHGRAVILAAGFWGAAIVGFGFAPDLATSLVCLAAAGAADMVSGLFRQRIWNETIPDRLRGRLAGLEMLSYTLGPALGNVEAGGVAALAGVRVCVVSGGLACVAGCAALAGALPALWSYEAAPSRTVS